MAAGRTPNLDDLGLETVGLDPTARTVEVDEHLRAGERLWAIGDITGKGAFTHVSMYQSAIALRDVLGEDGAPASYHAVPHVTFTDPEVGGVGMTEKQARDARPARPGRLHAARAVLARLHPRPRRHAGWSSSSRTPTGACWSVPPRSGPAGGEILGFLAVAVHAAVPVQTLREMIFAYPTFHRAIETALGELS